MKTITILLLILPVQLAVSGCATTVPSTPEVSLPPEAEEAYQTAVPEFRAKLSPVCSKEEMIVIERLWRMTVYSMVILDQANGQETEEMRRLAAMMPSVDRDIESLSPDCRETYLANR